MLRLFTISELFTLLIFRREFGEILDKFTINDGSKIPNVETFIDCGQHHHNLSQLFLRLIYNIMTWHPYLTLWHLFNKGRSIGQNLQGRTMTTPKKKKKRRQNARRKKAEKDRVLVRSLLPPLTSLSSPLLSLLFLISKWYRPCHNYNFDWLNIISDYNESNRWEI